MPMRHYTTISAFTGEFIATGAIVIAGSDGEGGVEVLGKIEAQPRQ